MRNVPTPCRSFLLITFSLLSVQLTLTGATGAPGEPKGKDLSGLYANRVGGAKREFALREHGGTPTSEAAVVRGLQWLVRQQMVDGRWELSMNLEAAKPAEPNHVAGTAFGLLPFLGAGKTHKPSANNPHDKVILKALNFLKRSQDKTGYFGGGMYAHGLATIAMCEAYALTQDPALRPAAQKAINLIVDAQSDKGSWDYGRERSDRSDMSVSGWQMQALIAGKAAGLKIPDKTMDGAKKFLDLSSEASRDNGYGYSLSPSTPRMSAVGLLARQRLNNWGPANPKLIDGIYKHIIPIGPKVQDCYFCYYATQVQFNLGGAEWKKWNDVLRENLIKKQDKDEKSRNFGSWSPAGDPWGSAGGRLMITSLNLLTLEVYYRHTPLFWRDAGYGAPKQDD